MYCSDCHGNNETTSATVPQGPHGSTKPYLLRFGNATWSTTAPTLNQTSGFCYNCHSSATIKNTNTVHSKSAHQGYPCQYLSCCHAARVVQAQSHGPHQGPFAVQYGCREAHPVATRSVADGYSASYCYSTCHEKHNNTSYAPASNANTYY